jgi:hypothetical protein
MACPGAPHPAGDLFPKTREIKENGNYFSYV